MRIINHQDLDTAQYALFYELKRFSVINPPTGMKIASPSGDTEIVQDKAPLSNGNNFEIVHLGGGRLAVAFAELGGFKFNNNVWVYGGDVSEPVSVRPFSGYEEVYNKPVDNSVGFFCFYNSVPVMAVSTQDWRCDKHTYGPRPFNDGVVTDKPLLQSLDDIIVYEPILSAAGIAHVVYAHVKMTTERDYTLINNAIIPTWGRTLSECLKLVWEWSKTVDEPWNCTDEVALKAKQFVDAFDLNTPEWDQHFNEYQVPMQVARYLAGDTTARLRPEGVLPITPKIQQFVRRYSAHSDLDTVIDLNINGFDWIGS